MEESCLSTEKWFADIVYGSVNGTTNCCRNFQVWCCDRHRAWAERWGAISAIIKWKVNNKTEKTQDANIELVSILQELENTDRRQARCSARSARTSALSRVTSPESHKPKKEGNLKRIPPGRNLHRHIRREVREEKRGGGGLTGERMRLAGLVGGGLPTERLRAQAVLERRVDATRLRTSQLELRGSAEKKGGG
jgi:hypothetical protein